MALFGFSDISFNKGSGSSERKGPLAPLVQNEFQTTLLRYPLDVGNADKGHYMVFYIREQRNTGFKSGRLMQDNFKFDDGSSAQQEILSGLTSKSSMGPSVGQQLLSKVNGALGQLNAKTNGALSGLTGAISKAAGGVANGVDNVLAKSSVAIGGNSAATSSHIETSIKSITGGSLGLLRTTKLTKDSIAMYMPDTLNYSYSQGYEDMPIGAELGGKILAAGASAIDEFKSGGGVAGGVGAVIKSAALEAAKGVSKAAGEATGEVLFAAMTGKVANPMLEMVYKAPSFRQFQFEFTFYPRNEREALEVQRIIERFRFHQAPELVSGAEGFLVPPSEFDIKFYYSGTQNPNIPPIASGCVLTQIDVNYTPNGFTAYEVPGENKPSLGRTGMPVAIQMQLQFKETTFLTKADFKGDASDIGKGQYSVTPTAFKM
jgi:hypothetical protein